MNDVALSVSKIVNSQDMKIKTESGQIFDISLYKKGPYYYHQIILINPITGNIFIDIDCRFENSESAFKSVIDFINLKNSVADKSDKITIIHNTCNTPHINKTNRRQLHDTFIDIINTFSLSQTVLQPT